MTDSAFTVVAATRVDKPKVGAATRGDQAWRELLSFVDDAHRQNSAISLTVPADQSGQLRKSLREAGANFTVTPDGSDTPVKNPLTIRFEAKGTEKVKDDKGRLVKDDKGNVKTRSVFEESAGDGNVTVTFWTEKKIAHKPKDKKDTEAPAAGSGEQAPSEENRSETTS